jgi:aspartyl-tRNA(Asn)/glutamyl-tRNA(Gln) amidotransferase subunit A
VRHEPPRIADLLTSEASYDAANASSLRTTMVLSYLGSCGVTLPAGGGGLLISAPEGRDEALLGIASRLDQLTRCSSG